MGLEGLAGQRCLWRCYSLTGRLSLPSRPDTAFSVWHLLNPSSPSSTSSAHGTSGSSSRSCWCCWDCSCWHSSSASPRLRSEALGGRPWGPSPTAPLLGLHICPRLWHRGLQSQGLSSLLAGPVMQQPSHPPCLSAPPQAYCWTQSCLSCPYLQGRG